MIFSAHGVSRAVEEEARDRQLTVFNATCPLVTKVHMEVQRYAREGRDGCSSVTPATRRSKALWDGSTPPAAAAFIWCRTSPTSAA